MTLRKKLLVSSLVYAVLDSGCFGRKRIVQYARDIKKHKIIIDIVQLRDKFGDKKEVIDTAYKISKELRNSGTLFIVNDYIDIAKIIGCDGIHLGQGDLSIKSARRILGPDKIIGVSCHNLKQALLAQKEGADYISIGPIFRTPAKPKLKPLGLINLRKISRHIHIPFFAIGGITKDNISFVASNGAKRVAFIRAIKQAAEIRNFINNRKLKHK